MINPPERLALMQPFWGSWYLDEMIGEGSYGKVYRIVRDEFGERYSAALKWLCVPQSDMEPKKLREEGMSDEEIREYFLGLVRALNNEIRLMSRMGGNSHIVNYTDHMIIERQGEIGWDILIRMELLETLNERIQRMPFTIGDVITLGTHILRALQLCEQRSILHRDIKPDNIFLSADGNYKLGDFGVARTMEHTVDNLSRKGTPVFMAPEVYFNQPSGRTADIYSLGLVLHRLLNKNRMPFLKLEGLPTHTERDDALTRRFRGEMMPPPLNGPEALRSVALKACAPDPNQRYQHADEMIHALECVKAENAKQLGFVLFPGSQDRRSSAVNSNRSSIDLYFPPPVKSRADLGDETVMLNEPSSRRAPHTARSGEFDDVQMQDHIASDVDVGGRPRKTRSSVAITCAAVIVLLACGGFAIWRTQIPVTPTAVIAPTAPSASEPPSPPTSAPTPVPTPKPTVSPSPEPPLAVLFADVGLEAAVRGYLGKPTEAVTDDDLESILSLYTGSFVVENLEDLCMLPNIHTLSLNISNLTDLEPLNGLNDLNDLRLLGNNDINVDSILDLPKLEHLDVGRINDADFVQLCTIKNLKTLSIHNGVSITSIKPIENLTSLESFYLSGSSVEDISPLKELDMLQTLTLVRLPKPDLSVLRGMRSLRELSIASTLVDDISPLESLTELETLSLSWNHIIDITPLKNLTKLETLTLLCNQIVDITPLKNLTELRSLSLSKNNIESIEVLRGLHRLEELDLSDNKILDLRPVKELNGLVSLRCVENPGYTNAYDNLES